MKFAIYSRDAILVDMCTLEKVWEEAVPVAKKIAINYVRKFPWIDVDDLSQSMLLKVPDIFRKFDPDRGAKWSTYLYLRLYLIAKDILRKEDPLGIKFPRSQIYPTWERLGHGDIYRPEPDAEAYREIVEVIETYVPYPRIFIQHVFEGFSIKDLLKQYPEEQISESIMVGNRVCVENILQGRNYGSFKVDTDTTYCFGATPSKSKGSKRSLGRNATSRTTKFTVDNRDS
jgi:hypothetical protein